MSAANDDRHPDIATMLAAIRSAQAHGIGFAELLGDRQVVTVSDALLGELLAAGRTIPTSNCTAIERALDGSVIYCFTSRTITDDPTLSGYVSRGRHIHGGET
jgi:DNA-binding transcriptional regulator YdaS (Cro superfamily)